MIVCPKQHCMVFINTLRLPLRLLKSVYNQMTLNSRGNLKNNDCLRTTILRTKLKIYIGHAYLLFISPVHFSFSSTCHRNVKRHFEALRVYLCNKEIIFERKIKFETWRTNDEKWLIGVRATQNFFWHIRWLMCFLI